MACEMCWLNCCYLDLNLLAGVVYKAFGVFGAGGEMRMIQFGLQLRWLLRVEALDSTRICKIWSPESGI